MHLLLKFLFRKVSNYALTDMMLVVFSKFKSFFLFLKKLLSNIVKIKKLKKKKFLKKKKIKKFKFKFKKFFLKKFKHIMCTVSNKANRKKNLLYFLKYYLAFRRRNSKLYTLARIKSKLHKRRFTIKKKNSIKLSKYFFKKYKYTSLEKKQSIVLNNINVFFKDSKRFDRSPRLYDIDRKYIRYLSSNRLIYKLFGFRQKYNFKFIKKHVRALSSLNIKNRIHMHECSLHNILIKLKYAFTSRNAKNLIKSGFVFLNGRQMLKSNNFLYKGDFIELMYCKFILKIKNKIKKKLLISMRRYKKYNWRMLKNKVEFSERKIRIFRFAEKILHFKDKITNSFQFDYRTLTFLIVKELNVKKDISFLTKKILPVYLIKLFNWKLIS